MTIQDYFEALVGQFLEVAGTSALNQCVDSVNFYIKWVLRLPPIEWTNAVDFPEKANRENYDWIENTETNKPIEGDIIVWKGAIGHIAVVFGNNATTLKFWSFDQNLPFGSACRVVEHSYSNVRGWLRPKSIPQSDQTLINQLRADRDKNWDLYIQEQKAKILLEDAVAHKQKTIDILTKENLDGKIIMDRLTLEKETILGQYSASQIALKDLQANFEKTTMDLEICMAQRKELGKYTTQELIHEILKRLLGR